MINFCASLKIKDIFFENINPSESNKAAAEVQGFLDKPTIKTLLADDVIELGARKNKNNSITTIKINEKEYELFQNENNLSGSLIYSIGLYICQKYGINLIQSDGTSWSKGIQKAFNKINGSQN